VGGIIRKGRKEGSNDHCINMQIKRIRTKLNNESASSGSTLTHSPAAAAAVGDVVGVALVAALDVDAVRVLLMALYSGKERMFCNRMADVSFALFSAAAEMAVAAVAACLLSLLAAIGCATAANELFDIGALLWICCC